MILVEMAFCLGLLALIGGACLYLWSVRAEMGPGVGFAKSLGILIIIFSILSLISSLISGIGMRKFYHQFRNPVNAPAREQNSPPADNSSGNNPPSSPQNIAPAPNNNTPAPDQTGKT